MSDHSYTAPPAYRQFQPLEDSIAKCVCTPGSTRTLKDFEQMLMAQGMVDPLFNSIGEPSDLTCSARMSASLQVLESISTLTNYLCTHLKADPSNPRTELLCQVNGDTSVVIARNQMPEILDKLTSIFGIPMNLAKDCQTWDWSGNQLTEAQDLVKQWNEFLENVSRWKTEHLPNTTDVTDETLPADTDPAPTKRSKRERLTDAAFKPCKKGSSSRRAGSSTRLDSKPDKTGDKVKNMAEKVKTWQEAESGQFHTRAPAPLTS